MCTRSLLVGFFVAATLAAPTARACGEGIFSMGDALRYDGYVASRPATVLIYEPDGDASEERIAVYRGLARAGHRVSVVSEADRLVDTLATQTFDIIVADGEYEATLAATAGVPARQLLVMPSKPARSAASAGRGYVDGMANLGTWLGALNRLMKD